MVCRNCLLQQKERYGRLGLRIFNQWNTTQTNSLWSSVTADTSKNGYRLPTEAEWEYAALGSYKDNENWDGYDDSSNRNTTGSTRKASNVFSGYDGTNSADIGSYVWYNGNSNNKVHALDKTDSTKKPNSYGLYDMCGNVSEWCFDKYEDYKSYDVTDPVGTKTSATMYVIRGNQFSSDAATCNVSVRSKTYPYLCYEDSGFRVVRTITE